MSNKPKHAAPEGTLRPGIRLAIAVLAGIAFVVASYLAWVSFGGRNVVGCGPESGCQTVLSSRWAYWFGVPVSAFGMLIYGALLGGAVCLGPKAPASRQRQAWAVLVPAAVLAVGAAVWFAAIQWFVLGTFCPFCMNAHTTALIAAILALRNAPYRSAPEKPWQLEKQVYMPPATARRLAAAAGLGLAGLVLGQFLHQKQTYREEAVVGGAQVETNTHTARVLELHGGSIRLNLDEVPLLGRRDAPNVMLAMHDYTCHGCRTMHAPLKTLLGRYSNELALVSLPLPLDSTCNPMVRRTPPAHTNACEYARISLAVWRAKPEAQEAFDDWVFEPHNPPPLEDTRNYARQLVGPEAFDRAMADPWVETQLQQDVALYTLNYQAYTNSSMPQFLIGNQVTFGSMTYEQLLQKFTNQYPVLP